MKRNSSPGWLVLASVFFLLATAAPAATFTIEARSSNTFSPANRTIQIGDTITWINRGGSHNTVGYLNPDRTTPVWRSPLPLSTFSHTFANAGSYYYECEPHAPGMSGTITVNAAANTPPTVSITAPTNNATFTAPATFEVQATAADANGTVASVQFFAGSSSLGTDTTSPFGVTASGLAAGSYALTARATDNSGATTTSGAVNVTVTEPTGGSITLSNVARAGAGIRFDVTGIAAGRTYRVEISADLGAWSTLTTGTAPGGTFTVTDTNPEGAPRRFYRVGI